MTARLPASTLHHHLMGSQRAQERSSLCHSDDTEQLMEEEQRGTLPGLIAPEAMAGAKRAG
jgi:hypothetical protein